MKVAELKFEYSFKEVLPLDPEPHNFVRQVWGAYGSLVEPTQVSAPLLIAWSDGLASGLGLEKPEQGSRCLEVLAGNCVLSNLLPHAVCYGGHQFGVWAGQLGDGRAITLGEFVASDGLLWELQLKGAGVTPYSRSGDGRAVLRSSIREFLASESMYSLGVPTTRALAVVGTGEAVLRDLFYTGDVRPEPGAIVVRLSPSFLRFGNFELFSKRKEFGMLEALTRWAIARDRPDLRGSFVEQVAEWFAGVCKSTALLINQWMRVGFVHGVMNTDNMSIRGETLDYGPFGWLDDFNSNWTPNISDLPARRYAYERQPAVALWNLERLAEALIPLGVSAQDLFSGLRGFSRLFNEAFYVTWGRKLGVPSLKQVEDQVLVDGLFELLNRCSIDMTIFFRSLKCVGGQLAVAEQQSELENSFYELNESTRMELKRWLRLYGSRLQYAQQGPEGQSFEDKCRDMDSVNPYIVPRNYICQLAIEAAERGDFSVLEELQQAFKTPYQESEATSKWAGKRPEWAKRPGCAQLSCSS